MIASPITGLVRGLNALIAGLAIQLQQIADAGHGAARGEAPRRSRRQEPLPRQPRPRRPPPRSPAEEAAGDRRRGARPTTTEDRETDAPSEGEEEKEG